MICFLALGLFLGWHRCFLDSLQYGTGLFGFVHMMITFYFSVFIDRGIRLYIVRSIEYIVSQYGI